MTRLTVVVRQVGTVAEFPIPTSNGGPQGITAGPDGNLWFAEFFGGNIGRITRSGTVTEFPIP
jgi:virginiamycin B lyase